MSDENDIDRLRRALTEIKSIANGIAIVAGSMTSAASNRIADRGRRIEEIARTALVSEDRK